MIFGRRTLNAAGWQAWIGMIRLAVGFGRFVVLARLLPIAVFGEFALATAIVGLSVVVPRFGLTAAFLHRAPETESEEPAASVIFTLRFCLTAVWACAVAVAALLGTAGGVRHALLVLVCCQLIAEPAFVPRLLCIRRLDYSRIALQETLSVVVGSTAAMGLAFVRGDLWALLAVPVCHAGLELVVFLGLKPLWRPRFAFHQGTARYLLGFGFRNLLIGIFDAVNERLPELATGSLLGTGALGIYNRAARLVSFPRRATTDPLVTVLPARFAELKHRPARFNAELKSSTAGLAIVTVLIAVASWVLAPWIIEHLLGPRWLPSLVPFRILSAMMVIEPLRLVLNSALVFRGAPGRAAWIRGLQACVLIPGAVAAAAAGTLAGVAASVVVSGSFALILLVAAIGHQRAQTSLDGVAET